MTAMRVRSARAARPASAVSTARWASATSTSSPARAVSASANSAAAALARSRARSRSASCPEAAGAATSIPPATATTARKARSVGMSGRMVVDVASMLRSCDRTGTATGTAGADPFWQARPDMGGTSTGAAIDDGITLGPRSPFEPVGVTPRYDPPRAWIHPDRERSWVARMQPIVVAHRGAAGRGRGGVGRRDDRPGRPPGGGPGGDRRRPRSPAPTPSSPTSGRCWASACSGASSRSRRASPCSAWPTSSSSTSGTSSSSTSPACPSASTTASSPGR